MMLKYKLKFLLVTVCAVFVMACQGNKNGNPDVPPVSKEEAEKFATVVQSQADKMKDLSASYANLQNEMKALQAALQQATPAQKGKVENWDVLMQKVDAVTGRAASGAGEIASLSATLTLTAQQLRDTFQMMPLVQGAYKNVYEPRCNEYLTAYERLPSIVQELRAAAAAAGIKVESLPSSAPTQ